MLSKSFREVLALTYVETAVVTADNVQKAEPFDRPVVSVSNGSGHSTRSKGQICAIVVLFLRRMAARQGFEP